MRNSTTTESAKVYLNGAIVNAHEAQVSIYDAGLLHGIGLFETMRSYGGKVFRLEDHLDRLYGSAQALAIPFSQSREVLQKGLEDVLAANELADARVRLTLTPGSLRYFEDDQASQNTVIITAMPMVEYPVDFYRYGMMVLISPYKQSCQEPTSGHKTVDYFNRLIALKQAQGQKAGEALWLTPGNRLAEGCISNVFLVDGERVLTPGLDTPVLAGITRKVVLGLARQAGIECEERELVIEDVLGASEIFLTNSVMELMPVCRVENHGVGDERPGPIYEKLRGLYKQAVEGECG